MNATRTINSARRILTGTALVVGLSAGLTACSLDWIGSLIGGGGGGGATTTTVAAGGTTTTVTAPAESTTTAVEPSTTTTAPTTSSTVTPVVDGAQVFAQTCAGCHGPNGEGTGGGPPLNATYSAAHDAAETLAVVNTGQGTMPAYGGVLTEAEIAAVVQYVHEGLATQ